MAASSLEPVLSITIENYQEEGGNGDSIRTCKTGYLSKSSNGLVNVYRNEIQHCKFMPYSAVRHHLPVYYKLQKSIFSSWPPTPCNSKILINEASTNLFTVTVNTHSPPGKEVLHRR